MLAQRESTVTIQRLTRLGPYFNVLMLTPEKVTPRGLLIWGCPRFSGFFFTFGGNTPIFINRVYSSGTFCFQVFWASDKFRFGITAKGPRPFSGLAEPTLACRSWWVSGFDFCWPVRLIGSERRTGLQDFHDTDCFTVAQSILSLKEVHLAIAKTQKDNHQHAVSKQIKLVVPCPPAKIETQRQTRLSLRTGTPPQLGPPRSKGIPCLTGDRPGNPEELLDGAERQHGCAPRQEASGVGCKTCSNRRTRFGPL